MISRKSTFCASQTARRLISLALLLSVCFSIVPLPVAVNAPTADAGKDRSEPFPCQDRPCGCRSAEQCRQHCCCFNREQKIAWARKNRIDVSRLVPNATPAEIQVCDVTTAKRGKTCCQNSTGPAADAHTTCSAKNSAPLTSEAETRTKFVIGIFADSCRGLTFGWNTLPWGVPAESEPVPVAHLPLIPLQIAEVRLPLTPGISPAVPPPRAV